MSFFSNSENYSRSMPLVSQPAPLAADVLFKILWLAPEPTFLFDACGRLALVNEAGIKLTELSPESARRAKMDDLFRCADVNGVPTTFAEILSIDVMELEASLAQGERASVAVTLRVHRLADIDGARYLLCSVEGSRDANRIQQQQILARISSEILR